MLIFNYNGTFKGLLTCIFKGYSRNSWFFSGMDYEGWFLLEARTSQEDRISAMKRLIAMFSDMRSS